MHPEYLSVQWCILQLNGFHKGQTHSVLPRARCGSIHSGIHPRASSNVSSPHCTPISLFGMFSEIHSGCCPPTRTYFPATPAQGQTQRQLSMTAYTTCFVVNFCVSMPQIILRSDRMIQVVPLGRSSTKRHRGAPALSRNLFPANWSGDAQSC